MKLSLHSISCYSKLLMESWKLIALIKSAFQVLAFSTNRSTGLCTRNVPLFENSHPSAARQLGLPMHSQSANFGEIFSSII